MNEKKTNKNRDYFKNLRLQAILKLSFMKNNTNKFKLSSIEKKEKTKKQEVERTRQSIKKKGRNMLGKLEGKSQETFGGKFPFLKWKHFLLYIFKFRHLCNQTGSCKN